MGSGGTLDTPDEGVKFNIQYWPATPAWLREARVSTRAGLQRPLTRIEEDLWRLLRWVDDCPFMAVTPEPEPVSPMGFSALAGLIGLAGGMVLAPWLERWYHSTVKHNREEDNE